MENLLHTFEQILIKDDFISPEGSQRPKLGVNTAEMPDQKDNCFKPGDDFETDAIF